MTTLEKLTRDFFLVHLGDDCKYNYRPDWLKYETGNNLELDIYYPKLKIAIEANGPQHKLTKENRKREEFKLERCKRRGVFLYRVERPQILQSGKTVWAFKQFAGLRIDLGKTSFSLARKLKRYKPHNMKFVRVLNFKDKMERHSDIQAAETAFNKAKMERFAVDNSAIAH